MFVRTRDATRAERSVKLDDDRNLDLNSGRNRRLIWDKAGEGGEE